MASSGQRGPSFVETVKEGFFNIVSKLPGCASLATQKCPYALSDPYDGDLEMVDFATVKAEGTSSVRETDLVHPPKVKRRPLIAVKPEGLRFETVVLPSNSAQELPITITSTGTDTLRLGGLTDAPEGDFDLKIRPGFQMELEPGESATVKYAFRPQARGDRSSTFTVSSNAENPEAGRATLSGLVKQKVKPVAALAAKVIALKGAGTTLSLSADVPDFNGKGVLTIPGSGKDRVKLSERGTPIVMNGNEVSFELPATIDLEVKPSEGSASLDDVQFQWELKDGGQYFVVQPAVTEKLTVVKATLDIHKKSGTALGSAEKMAPGRVIHLQNADKERNRAKIVITCSPAAFVGQVKLSAVKDIIEIYDAPKDGKKIDLPYTMDVGSGKTPATLYVQGAQVSGGAGDTGLTLQIVDPAEDSDEVKITVVETKLQLCEKRISSKVDPIELADGVKSKKGRAVYKQHPKKFLCDRAKMRLTMEPHDAPCTLILKEDTDKVRVYPEEATLHVPTGMKPAYDEIVTLERHSSAEKVERLPKSIAPGQIVKDKGLVFWAEGKDLTGSGKQLFQVDIDEVDEKCDAVAVQVALPPLDVEVIRSDNKDLSKEVTVKLTEGTTGYSFDTSLKGLAHKDVEADEYAIGLELHGDEKGTKPEEEWRVKRTDPDDSQTRVMVKEPRTVKFLLEPPYLKVQFIAYAIKTGAYDGTDIPSNFAGTPEEKKEKAAVHDMEARCKIMEHAILQAKANIKVQTGDSRVLKIFMAPEFYFRGKQGGYPIDTVHKIMGYLAEPGKGDYADWVFVFGSAIGYLEGLPKGAKKTGRITGIADEKFLFISCATGSPAENVAPGWKFEFGDKMAKTTTVTIATVYPKTVDGVKTYIWVRLATSAEPSLKYVTKFSNGLAINGEVSVERQFKPIGLDMESATPIVAGAVIEQGTTKGVVKTVAATTIAPKTVGNIVYDLEVHIPLDQKFKFGAASFTEPGETEVFNVALVKKGGTGTPVKADGSGQKELLIYKESISSVDFMGPEYGQQGFYQPEHHIVKLHDDEDRRVLPTEGSTAPLGKNPNPQKTGGASEVNKSGLGGGMVFTMDGITFGVEVCLDHGDARLKNYYDPSKGGAPPASEPNVQVHLIPSCGMSIKNPCVVKDGLVFNVDATHVAAEDAKRGGIAIIDATAIKGGPATAGYFPSSGLIVVYEPADRPKETTM